MAKQLPNPKEVAIQQTGLKLKFNPGPVIASLVRSVADISTSTLTESTIAEWAKALNIKAGKERQAYNLVANSLIEACRTQLRHRLEQVDIDENENLVFRSTELRFEVFNALEQNEYSFNCDHLSNPAAFLLLQDFKPYYEEWLRDTFQMPPTQSEDYAADFPSYFAYEFSRQLLTKSKDYEDLVKHCESRFNEETQRALARMQYRAELKKKYHQPALGEKLVALSDVYIEPDFLVFEKAIGKKRLEVLKDDPEWHREEHFCEVGYSGNIHDYLLQHFIPKKQSKEIDSQLETGQLMVLLGHPGHGKSSFCYRAIHDLLKDPNFHGNAFFLRLQDADKTILDADFEQFAKLLPESHAIGFADWVDKKHGQTNLLFLDGLDEFHMAQSPTDDEVRQFIFNCKKLVEGNPHLYIIITSRFHYVETHKLHQYGCLVLSLDVLSEEQQKTLVQNFSAKWQEEGCTLTEEEIKRINEDKSQQHIKELIELPILLQMVLMAKVPLEANASRATIYDKLFDQVLQRKWDDNKRLKKYIQDDVDFGPEHLREYLAFLAFKTFQGKKGYLRKSEVARYKETIQFKNNYLKTSTDDNNMKQVLKDILTSFYLQESQKKPDDQFEADKEYNYVIEFMHKSLYEYLACEHIWQNTLDFFLETDKRGKVKTRSLEEVQKQMQETYATIRHTSETVEYMKEIIDNKREQHRELAEQMGIHFPGLLEEGFIFSYQANAQPEEIRFKPEQLVLNAFHTYWLIFGSLCLHEVEVDEIMEMNWEDLVKGKLNDEKFRELLGYYWNTLGDINFRLLANNTNAEEFETEKDSFVTNMMVLKTQTEANLSNQERKVTDWICKYLIYVQGDKSMKIQNEAISICGHEFARYLRLMASERMEMGLNCWFINLFVEDLVGIQFIGINLFGSNLERIELALSNLSGANLAFANLKFAELDLAILNDTIFIFADLSEASLEKAYIVDANFYGADLAGVDFTNAQIMYSAFISTALEGANLTNAKIEGSNFENASFENATLKNTKFDNVNLKNANLAYARVSTIDWLENLSKSRVNGAEDLQRRFRINPKSQFFREEDESIWEGYEIEIRNELAGLEK